MKITKLEYQKKDPNRVSIYVDDKFAVGLSADAIIKFGIYKDQEISADFLEKIISESDFGKLLNHALNFVSFRPRSEWEIRHKYFKEQYLDELVEKLKVLKVIDDYNFAKWFLEQRQTFRPKGKLALKIELSKLGIAKNIIDQIFAENPVDEKALAHKLFSKRFKKNYDPVRAERLLRSRGFSWDTINSVIDKKLVDEV